MKWMLLGEIPHGTVWRSTFTLDEHAWAGPAPTSWPAETALRRTAGIRASNDRVWTIYRLLHGSHEAQLAHGGGRSFNPPPKSVPQPYCIETHQRAEPVDNNVVRMIASDLQGQFSTHQHKRPPRTPRRSVFSVLSFLKV
jgi:hypothetical protein